MNSKRTHKLAGLGNVADVVRMSTSVAAAARKLGVRRESVYRWIQAGKVPKPKWMGVKAMAPGAVLKGITPEEWGERIKSERKFDVAGLALVDLAVKALRLTTETEPPMVRLAATARFAALVKQLGLTGDAAASEGKSEHSELVRVPTVRRVTHDPRQVLMAVK